MSTATRKRQRDPFDVSEIANPLAEKALVAHLLPVFRNCRADAAELADARRILAAVDPDMLTEPVAADAIAAYREAIQADPPTMADITKAARRRAETVDGSAKEIISFIADVGNSTESWRAATRLADEAASEIIDAYARRQGIEACSDAVGLLREGGAKAGQITAVIDKLAGLAALADRRAAGGRRLRVRKASEIEPKPIEWLWPRRISRGSLTIITGLPGLSKTTLTYDIAARITTGGKWPDGTGSAPRGGVILFGMEDDPEKVVVPRLMAADADLELIRIVDGAEDGRRRDESWLTPVSIDRDLALLREQLDAFPECRVIVFDPLSQFVEAEENSNAHTRAALAPLVNLAQERGVAVIGIMHMSKKTDSMMIQRIAGASSYGQIARHIIFVGNDTDDNATGLDRRRVMIVVKNSYGPSNCGQLYRVTTRRGDQPGIEWIAGTVERDAEALNPKPAGVSRDYQEQRGEAVDAMRELLAGGPRPSVEVEGALKSQGFRRRQIDYAADLLEIDKRQARGPDGRRAWLWSLPAGDAAEPDHELPTPHDAIPASEWRAH